MHLADVDNKLIPTIEKSNQDTESLKKSINEKLYRELKSTKLMEFKDGFAFSEAWKYQPAMYRFLQIRMPTDVMFNILDGHLDTRKIMVKWNSINKSKPTRHLILTDPDVQ